MCLPLQSIDERSRVQALRNSHAVPVRSGDQAGNIARGTCHPAEQTTRRPLGGNLTHKVSGHPGDVAVQPRGTANALTIRCESVIKGDSFRRDRGGMTSAISVGMAGIVAHLSPAKEAFEPVPGFQQDINAAGASHAQGPKDKPEK